MFRDGVMLKAYRRIRNYITYDLKEIIAPSPLLNPPGEKPEKFRLADLWRVLHSLGACTAQQSFCWDPLSCKNVTLKQNIPSWTILRRAMRVQAVRLGTREYLDTWKKQAPAAGEEKGTPKEPPIIDELRESPFLSMPWHMLPTNKGTDAGQFCSNPCGIR